MIVDAQVHLWLANTPDRPWLPNRVAQLPEPFLVEQLVPMMDEAGVERAVIVPPSWEGNRNDYALEAVRRYPTRFAVMGRLPVNDPNTAKLLPDWKKQPGMLGIRVTFHPPQWHWLTDGSVDWFWPLAEKYRLPVMFYGAPMAHFERVAERYPQLTMIADHLGVSTEMAKEGKTAAGVKETAALAKYPNVSVKTIDDAILFRGTISVPRHDQAHPPAVRRVWSAPLLLGHRSYQLLSQGQLSTAHYAFHRDARFSLQRGQRFGDGPCHSGAARMEITSHITA
jgi:predicted TIM-barrel fold metal-dependent hydrolase